jgi:uncharacterized membrane protein
VGRRRRTRGLARQQHAPQSADPFAREAIMIAQTEIHTQVTSGPLPSPEILREYDLLVPGAAERFIARFEKQSDHRMALERAVIDGENRRSNRGQWIAGGLGLVALLVAGTLGITGHETAAVAVVGIDFASLAGAFIYGTISRRQERTEKTRVMTGQAPR